MQVDTTIIIERPATEVFDYIADMANDPDWKRGLRSCTWTTDPPLRVGSRYDQVTRFPRRRASASFEVVELDPDRIRMVSTGETMPSDVTRTVAPEGIDRCSVSTIVRTDLGPRVRLLRPLLTPLVLRWIAAEHRRLKERLETAN